ncbi:hypothetical protein H5410_060210, partial [Solanum commersonii]
MMKNKHKVEEHIRWKINSGSCSIWWDDWLGDGALAKHTTHISSLNNSKVSHFLVPLLLIPQILNTNFQYQEGLEDSAIWKPNEQGSFSCASARDIFTRKIKMSPIL